MRGPGAKAPTREGLGRLMAYLGVDEDQAAEEFGRLRRRLIKMLEIRMFEHGLRAASEDLADEAISRVARKLDEGLEIRATDPYAYLHGVARLVLKEAVRDEAKVRDLPEHLDVPAPAPDPERAESVAQRCLDACLDRLSDDDCRLILEFYREDGGARRIAHRKRLAAELGLTTNALRIRAHRLRRQLEPCIVECLEASDPEEPTK